VRRTFNINKLFFVFQSDLNFRKSQIKTRALLTMKLLSFTIFLLSCFVMVQRVVSNQVSCEVINACGGWTISPNHRLHTCRLLTPSITSIYAPGFRINSLKDFSVTGINSERNKNIQFLPENVYEVFPNLEGYNSHACAIKIISKANFQGLNKLKDLNLHTNQIEMLISDSFQDLTSLNLLQLRKKIF
jgi:Leucine rich repeat